MTNAVILFLFLYALIGVFARFSSNKEEDIYPFFSWFLFSNVPSRVQTDFDIRIMQAGDKRFDPPILFEHAKNIYSTDFPTARYFNIIKNFGTSIKQNSEDRNFRQQLEANFLLHPVIYEVVEITFNPIERFSSGKIIDLKKLGEFTSRPNYEKYAR